MPRALRTLLTAAIAASVGWWLFGDTVRHYRPSPADPHTIRFAHFGTYQDYETWGQVIAAFERQHPGLTVRQEYVVGMYGAYETKLRQQMLSKTLPHVFLMQLGPFAAMADGFADLTDRVADPSGGIELAGFPPSAVEAFTHRDRLRGLPVSGGNLLIYCNPDCFRRAATHRGCEIPLPGDDWNMDQFRALAELLTCDFDGDGRLDQFGFWQPRWVYYLPFLWSFGADVLDESEARWLLVGAEAEQALAFYQRLLVGDRVSPRPDEVAQMFQDVGFLTGKTAMCVNGPWFLPFLADTRLAGRCHVAHVPTGPGGRVTRITWDGICMAGHLPPQEQDAAWRFVRFVCSEQAQGILACTQRALPALTAAAPHFTRADAGRCSGRFVEALAYSRLQPQTLFFRELDQAVNRHLADLLRASDPITPARCLADLAADPGIATNFRVLENRP